jgi:hypothetical protein
VGLHLKYAGICAVTTALLVASCQHQGRAEFEAQAVQFKPPDKRRAAIQRCVKGVTPIRDWDRPWKPGAVKWCTDFVNDLASGRYTYEEYLYEKYGGGPKTGYQYRTDSVATVPAP